MHCLLVYAHPLQQSLCHHLAATAAMQLRDNGHEVEQLDLYDAGFRAPLSAPERKGYYAGTYATEEGDAFTSQLLRAEGLVLCFPTWWFGLPAILKGWFDRVWGPGIAYDHADDLGRIRPRLSTLRRAVAVTTLGSPWWVDRLVMRQPVRRTLGTALLGTCAPACEFRMLSLYNAEKVASGRLQAFERRLGNHLQRWR